MAQVNTGYTWASGNTVTAALLNQSVNSATVTDIQTADIADGQITNAKVNASAGIAYSKLNLANSIVAGDIASNAVTTPKIANANVTQAKLASGIAGTGPAFRAYATSTTSVSGPLVSTKVNLDAETFDTSNSFSASRFTPNVAGYYLINASIRIDGASTAAAELRVNNAGYSRGTQVNGATFISSVSDIVYLNGSTDFVELFVFHGDSATRTVSASSSETYMSGCLLRAA